MLRRIVASARVDRCCLRDKWDAGAALTGREQLHLARTLVKVRPTAVERSGRRVPCEPRFELRPKDRRRLVEALLDEEGVSSGEIMAVVPGLSRRTFNRIRSDARPAKTPPANGFAERRFRTKRGDPVGRPQMAYLDATSGANVEAEQRFRELVGATA